MRSKRTHALVFATLVAMASFWLLRRTPGPSSQAATPEEETAAPLESATKAASVPRLKVAAAPPAVEPPPRTPSAAEIQAAKALAPFQADTFTPEQALERAREKAELNDRWTAEPADAAWATETTNRVSALLASAGVDPLALRDVDCRATICRFSLHSER